MVEVVLAAVVVVVSVEVVRRVLVLDVVVDVVAVVDVVIAVNVVVVVDVVLVVDVRVGFFQGRASAGAPTRPTTRATKSDGNAVRAGGVMVSSPMRARPSTSHVP